MTADWRDAERIFHEALEQDETRREAFVRDACAGAEGLLRDVLDLLASYETARDGFLATPAGGTADPDPHRIGPYRLLEVLGEGGMGTVWLAEQEEPIRRRVALKLVRAGFDSEQVVARFEAERQTLAIMTHPHIASVHDAGTAPDGRPYFVMEHVPGDPITKYCFRRSLPVRERLGLLLQVCDAVQHAHQKGVVHRDLKPSNVLVTERDGEPLPVVIDFGVAKAITADPRADDRQYLTRAGQMIGTPEYMSPEQTHHGGREVDTRTDVYSLGVLLYELLTEQLPFDFSDAHDDLTEIIRRIRDDDPPLPSTRCREPGGARRLRGDLDWIVARALEKEPERRYASASELAADIGRHLRDEPVLAAPPRTWDRVRKFTRRHRLPVVTGALLFLGAFAFAGAMAVQTGRIARERDRANREAETAAHVSQFLVDVFRISDPDEARGRRVTAREILAAATEGISGELREEDPVRARLLGTLGEVHANLGLLRDAEPLLSEALALHRNTFGDRHRLTLEVLDALASLYRDQGDYEKAEPLQLEAWEGARGSLGPEHPQTLRAANNLAHLHMRRGRWDDAEALYRDVLAIQRRTSSDDDPDLLSTMNNLGALYVDRGTAREAIAFFQEVLERRRETLGNDHSHTMTSMNNLAVALMETGALAEAEVHLREAHALQTTVLGPLHPETLRTGSNLARVHMEQGDLEESEALLTDVLAGQRQALGADHPETLVSLAHLAKLHLDRGDLVQAGAVYREIFETRRSSLGESHPETLRAMNNLAVVRRRAGALEEAESLLRELIAVRSPLLGPDHVDTVRARSGLALVWERQGRLAEAEAEWTDVLKLRAGALGPDHRDTVRSAVHLARVRTALEDWSGAAAVLRRAAANGLDPSSVLEAEEFETLRARPEFAAVAELLAN